MFTRILDLFADLLRAGHVNLARGQFRRDQTMLKRKNYTLWSFQIFEIGDTAGRELGIKSEEELICNFQTLIELLQNTNIIQTIKTRKGQNKNTE